MMGVFFSVDKSLKCIKMCLILYFRELLLYYYFYLAPSSVDKSEFQERQRRDAL